MHLLLCESQDGQERGLEDLDHSVLFLQCALTSDLPLPGPHHRRGAVDHEEPVAGREDDRNPDQTDQGEAGRVEDHVGDSPGQAGGLLGGCSGLTGLRGANQVTLACSSWKKERKRE